MVDTLFFAWQMTALASCLIAGIAMIYFFIKFAHTRTHPGPVLLSIFLSMCISNIMRVGLQTWVYATNQSSGASRLAVSITDVANKELGARTELESLDQYVPFFFWCFFFFLTSATMWYLMLALDLIFSLSNPFLPFNVDNLKHHIFAWPIALFYCIGFRYVLTITDMKRIHHVAFYFHLPEYIVLIYITGALGIAWRRSRRLELQAHETTRRMAKLILPYLAVFALYTIEGFIMYLLSLSGSGGGHETPTRNAIDQLAQVLECLAIFVLFCRDARVLTAMSPSSSSTPSSSLLDEQHRTRSQLELNTTLTTEFSLPTHEKLDISNKLRMDVMKYTSMGIQQSIKQSIEHSTSTTITEIGLEEYNAIESMSIVIHGQSASSVLNFRDCAPKVFQHLRSHFQIDPVYFLQSFDQDKILSEHGSEGKSGNLFYFTANKQFMVKSVPKTEYDTLRGILPHYHRYLLSNPQSLLCRYYGCYSISLPVGKRRMYFVVMQNLFNEGPVHHRFDLKGNTDRRQAIAACDVEKYITDAREQRTIEQLMMDIDFRKLCGGMELNPSVGESVQGQLCDDIVFLASRGIIDYSILLGVRFVEKGEHTGTTTGILSYDTEVIYNVGMIDMLQRYNWRWTVQRWVLGLLCKDTDDVSAVPPELYASRLEEFVRSRLFDIQEERTNGNRPEGKTRRTPSQVHHPPPHRVLTINPTHSQFHATPMFLSEAQMSPSDSVTSEVLSSSAAYSSVCQSPLSRPSSSTNYSIHDPRPSTGSNASTGDAVPIAPMGLVATSGVGPQNPGYFI